MIETLTGKIPRKAIYFSGDPLPARPDESRIPAAEDVPRGDLDAWLDDNFLPEGVERADPATPEHWREVDDVDKGRVRVVPGTETTELVNVYGFAIKEPVGGLELYRQDPPSVDAPGVLTNKAEAEGIARKLRDRLELGKPRDEVIAELDANVEAMVEQHGERLDTMTMLRSILEKRTG